MKEITRTPQSRPAKKDRNLTRWLFVAPAMLVVLCLLVYPLCSTLLYSFTNKTLIKSTYALKGIDNYIKIFTDPAFGKAFLTTLVWTFFSLTGQILIGFSAALALNRISNPIARPIYRICMIIPWAFPSIAIALVWKWMLNGIQGYIPTIMLVIPYAMVMAKLNLTNTRIGLMLVYLSFSVPYAVWMLVGFFKTVPIGIEEAARIDGANKLQVFVRIVLPLVSPGIVATAIYVFINAWNEYLYSMILMSSSDKTTISVAVKTLEGADILNWGSLMAACAIVVVPSIIFFCFIQNKMAGGLSDGAVK